MGIATSEDESVQTSAKTPDFGQIENYPALALQYGAEISRTARRLSRGNRDLYEDLEQIGKLALWRAAQCYRADRATPFAHYARRTFSLEIRNAARQADVAQRVTDLMGRARWSFGDQDKVQFESVDEILSDPAREMPEQLVVLPPTEETLDYKAKAPKLIKWLDSLPLRLRAVYAALYIDDLSTREAARVLDVSHTHVRQLNTELVRQGRAFFGITTH